MTDPQECKKISTTFISTRSFKDLIVIAIILLIVFIFSYYFNVFFFIIKIFEKYPKYITYIDEILTFLITFSICFAVYSWRRWIELKKETAQRLEVEDELIRIANTKADVEKIISKQLRCEIELRREEKKSFLHFKK